MASKKQVAIPTTKKELKTLSRFDLEQESRKQAYQEQRSAVSVLQVMPCNDNKGNDKLPNGAGIMTQFNKRVKQHLGYSCDEIDQIQDVFLCNAVRSLRDEFTQVAKEYINGWQGTFEQYEELKRILWLLPVIAKENLSNKTTRINEAKK